MPFYLPIAFTNLLAKAREKSLMLRSLRLFLDIKKTRKEKIFVVRNDWKDSNISYSNNRVGYKIKLKGEKLLVQKTCNPCQMHLLSNRSEQFLADWLQFSPAKIVQIDSRIELENIYIWANQCQRLGKAIFLRLSRKVKLYQNKNRLNKSSCLIKRWLDFFGALILLIILAPIFVALALLIRIYFKEPILQSQWCVGKQGKLFSIYKFGGNLTKINLDIFNKLPQLLNVLKGDMSFVGRFPWSVAEAIEISLLEQDCLSILPGISASFANKE